MRRLIVISLVVACAGAPARDPPPAAPAPPRGAPVKAQGYLRFNITRTEDNRVAYRTATWIDARGREVWTRKVPGRLGRLTTCCWSETSVAYMKDPAAHADYVEYESPLVLDDVLVLHHEAQIWVLSLADGRTVYDWSDNSSRRHTGDLAVVDQGALEITVGGHRCASALHHQGFVRACGDKLVYFDRGKLALFSRTPYRLDEVRRISGTGQECRTPSKQVERTERIGDATVRFTGERLTMCMH